MKLLQGLHICCMQDASKQIALGHRLCRSQLGDANDPAFLFLRLCALGTTLEPHKASGLLPSQEALRRHRVKVLKTCLALQGRWPK
jgi:hypothetical protein